MSDEQTPQQPPFMPLPPPPVAAAPAATPLQAESVAEARLEFDRLMNHEGPGAGGQGSG